MTTLLHDSDIQLISEHQLPNSIQGTPRPEQTWKLSSGRAAAVCVLFIPPATGIEAHIVLIRRTTNLSSHKGQIGLPGGHKDPEDQNPTITALRELEEEIGLAKSKVNVHGQLPSTNTIDGNVVVPIICSTLVSADHFKPSESEVADIFTAPWSTFSRSQSDQFHFNLFGVKKESCLFRVGRNNVWGLTAKILYSADFK